MPSDGYKTVKDADVQIIWSCPRCFDEAGVNPDYFQESGTPCCGECELDMEYLRTEVRKDAN